MRSRPASAPSPKIGRHRKRQQAQHPRLTLTDMYNVLAKLRSGEPLSMAEKVVHEQGLVSVLRQLHDELDAAVFDAYGWPVDAHRRGDPGAAGRSQRRARRGGGAGPHPLAAARIPGASPITHSRFTQHVLIKEDSAERSSNPLGCTLPPLARPHGRAGPGRARRAGELAGPASAAQVAAAFAAAPAERVAELLETLVTLGQARQTDEGRFVG